MHGTLYCCSSCSKLFVAAESDVPDTMNMMSTIQDIMSRQCREQKNITYVTECGVALTCHYTEVWFFCHCSIKLYNVSVAQCGQHLHL